MYQCNKNANLGPTFRCENALRLVLMAVYSSMHLWVVCVSYCSGWLSIETFPLWQQKMFELCKTPTVSVRLGCPQDRLYRSVVGVPSVMLKQEAVAVAFALLTDKSLLWLGKIQVEVVMTHKKMHIRLAMCQMWDQVWLLWVSALNKYLFKG